MVFVKSDAESRGSNCPLLGPSGHKGESLGESLHSGWHGKEAGYRSSNWLLLFYLFIFFTPPFICRDSPLLCLDKELWHWRLRKLNKQIHHHKLKDKGSTHSLKLLFLCWMYFSIIPDHPRFTSAASLGGFPLCHGHPKRCIHSLRGGTFELFTSAFAQM